MTACIMSSLTKSLIVLKLYILSKNNLQRIFIVSMIVSVSDVVAYIVLSLVLELHTLAWVIIIIIYLFCTPGASAEHNIITVVH